MAKVRFGGSFAPPLSPQKLAEYKVLANAANEQTKEAMLVLVRMLEKFWETGESSLPGTPHPSGRGMIVPLEDAELARIEPVVPWPAELEMYGKLFNKLDANSQKPLRNAAFHLLWYGKELCNDREPITNDKI